METIPPPQLPVQKKSIGVIGILGIGCGAIIGLFVLACVVLMILYGGTIRKFAEDAQKNPTRAAANLMVDSSRGKMELAAADDEHLRYTVRDKASGVLTTLYWDEKKHTTAVISGDFSAIPAPPAASPEPPAE